MEEQYFKYENEYYCIYCGNEIKPKEHFYSGSYDSYFTYDCTCELYKELIAYENELLNIKNKISNLKYKGIGNDGIRQLKLELQIKKAEKELDDLLKKKNNKY